MEVIVMSSTAAWAVWSFSLESKRTLAAVEDSAMPKLLPGVVSHAFTWAVRSTVTNWPAVAAENVVIAVPRAGAVAAVMPDSVQAAFTGDTVTVPAALTRFTKKVTFAPEMFAAVVPAGSAVRSNSRYAVLPLPT
jgi:hypothetical protein